MIGLFKFYIWAFGLFVMVPLVQVFLVGRICYPVGLCPPLLAGELQFLLVETASTHFEIDLSVMMAATVSGTGQPSVLLGQPYFIPGPTRSGNYPTSFFGLWCYLVQMETSQANAMLSLLELRLESPELGWQWDWKEIGCVQWRPEAQLGPEVEAVRKILWGERRYTGKKVRKTLQNGKWVKLGYVKKRGKTPTTGPGDFLELPRI